MRRLSALLLVCAAISACSTRHASTDRSDTPANPPTSVVSTPVAAANWIAQPALQAFSSEPPPLVITTIDVRNLPISALLQALSQQEGLSHDVDECGAIPISLTQKRIELTQLLTQVSDLARVRWTLRNDRIAIRCDQPLSRTYSVNYPNVERSGSLTGTAGLPGNLTLAGAGGNSTGGTGVSQLTSSRHQNRFWDSLVQTLEQALAASEELPEPIRITETEQTRSDVGQPPVQSDRKGRQPQRDNGAAPQPPQAMDSTASKTVTVRAENRRSQVHAHPESGLMHIRATARQHRLVSSLIARALHQALQQVEIEALLLEVRLSQQYERGIQWSKHGVSLTPAIAIPGSAAGLIFNRTANGDDSLNLAIRFLEQFGAVRVVSSPRVATLNQQAALLRMVENKVYFTLSAQTVPAGPNSAAFSTFNTQAHSVPVGFVMSALPSIEAGRRIALTLKPSLSRIIGFVSDPNPGLVSAGINSRIPEIQTREIESVLQLHNDQTALLGGFFQSESRLGYLGIPGIGATGALHWATSSENSEENQTELVILIRARITEAAESSS